MSPEVNAQEFYARLDEVLEVEPGTIKGGESLADMASWDSIAVLSFIAMVDRDYGVRLPPKDLAQSKSVEALIDLVVRSAA